MEIYRFFERASRIAQKVVGLFISPRGWKRDTGIDAVKSFPVFQVSTIEICDSIAVAEFLISADRIIGTVRILAESGGLRKINRAITYDPALPN